MCDLIEKIVIKGIIKFNSLYSPYIDSYINVLFIFKRVRQINNHKIEKLYDSYVI